MAGKWKVSIVWYLSYGPLRFSAIRKLLPGVSEKVLTAQLRELQGVGVLDRRATPDVPPHVTYTLTAAGKELVIVMVAMCGWGTKHLGVPPNPEFLRFERKVARPTSD